MQRVQHSAEQLHHRLVPILRQVLVRVYVAQLSAAGHGQGAQRAADYLCTSVIGDFGWMCLNQVGQCRSSSGSSTHLPRPMPSAYRDQRLWRQSRWSRYADAGSLHGTSLTSIRYSTDTAFSAFHQPVSNTPISVSSKALESSTAIRCLRHMTQPSANENPKVDVISLCATPYKFVFCALRAVQKFRYS